MSPQRGKLANQSEWQIKQRLYTSVQMTWENFPGKAYLEASGKTFDC